MAKKSVWTGSALLLFICFFRAYAGVNDSLSSEVGNHTSPPSVTTILANTDDVKTIKLNTTKSPITVQPGNETALVNATVKSLNSSNYQNHTKARMETTQVSTTTGSTNTSLAPRPSDRMKIEWDNKWEEPFKYDYTSLRQAGLTIAAVLFIMGIMLIACGKMRCSRRCQLTKGRSYEVTRM
ncbi:FXYD domain containing ion transport regulator 5 [Silurus meridionalis]|uniref:FXYD domain-containing ion transport regulator n=1 Tax=Silurus meridionalis TaxID=175797 RepID=A0A8T0B5I0_SILME|nr:FXYD domain containing ion transport regulator 5 [Silurus meridionalis]KAF7700293.1 hypothetical protein HF521_003251 [Silurus meridionalis]